VTGRFGRQTNSRFGTSIARSGIEVSLAEGQPVRRRPRRNHRLRRSIHGYGTLVIVDHGDSNYSLYGHLSSIDVARGSHVDAQAQLGSSGRDPAATRRSILSFGSTANPSILYNGQEVTMTLKTRLSILLLSTPVLIFVCCRRTHWPRVFAAGDDTFRELRVFNDVLRLSSQLRRRGQGRHRAMEGAMKGLAEGLDPDSAYLNPQQVSEVQSGASLARRGSRPRADTASITFASLPPATGVAGRQKPGLQTGDYVRAIDGKADARHVGLRRHAPVARPTGIQW
jgi:hypothetical protein